MGCTTRRGAHHGARCRGRRLAALCGRPGGPAVHGALLGRDGLVAAAGLVLALAPVLGGWTSGLDLRLSRGTFAARLAADARHRRLDSAGDPAGERLAEGTIVSWSTDLGLMGVVHSLGALARRARVRARARAGVVPRRGACCDAGCGDGGRRRRAADEPLVAEQREAAYNAEPHTVVVGPAESDVILLHEICTSLRQTRGDAGCASPQPLTQGSCFRGVRVDRSSGMNAVPHERGLALLLSPLRQPRPGSPTARERLERSARARSGAQARVRALERDAVPRALAAVG